MNHYEVNVTVDHVSPELAEKIVDELDGTSGHDHAGAPYMSAVFSGDTYLDALRAAARWLEDNGAHCLRVHEDLVTKSDIASRLSVTRQAVHQWVTGKRGLAGFPAASNPVSGGVWLWGDVQRWAMSKGSMRPNAPLHPLLEDIDEGNACLRERAARHRANADLGRVMGVRLRSWAGEPAPRSAADRPEWGHLAVRTSNAYEKDPAR
ncbi:hypothetical protein [Ornithinimicrobium sp. INDO-MA30-4]|uniref:hypothetical protein n=1 Tax=Ornithinimicrobium sp. INDO-MA30-4 TaxID=2908651 RepID=UPI001F48912F|nr:hypothetical protein [Ornithinimicrobium sp. INDO-MA30-4]UJH69600.1 hypothetical protein L0A91_09540 [Ornithinimicrobium sp. INDO-MA30-4]